MLVQICLIMLVMTQPDILPDEIEWLDDPNILATLFVEWDEERPRKPYLSVPAENWGLTTRVRNYPTFINGEWYNPWTAPYSWVGDLNHDGVVNLKDFGILAQYFKGRFTYSPPIPPPSRSRLEVIADIVGELFMNESTEE